MRKPLATETREPLGIESWELSGIEAANQLSTTVSILMLITTQISEFNDLPDISDEGLEMIQANLTEPSEALQA